MRQGVFCGLLLRGVSLGRNFAEFQKTRDEGVLAKFAIARLCGQMCSLGRDGRGERTCLSVERLWWPLRAEKNAGRFEL